MAGATCESALFPLTPASSTSVPHPWQVGHRPLHFGCWLSHLVQENIGRRERTRQRNNSSSSDTARDYFRDTS